MYLFSHSVVEIQLPIVVLLFHMVTVVIQHAVLVSAVHDMDSRLSNTRKTEEKNKKENIYLNLISVAVVLVYTVLRRNHQKMSQLLQSMVNFVDKLHITMQPKLAHNIRHVVLNELVHQMKVKKKSIQLLLIKLNSIHTLSMVFQATIQSVTRKLQ